MNNQLEKSTDDSSLQSFSEGNKEAFDILLKRYYPSLRSYIVVTMGDANLADDIFQDTFIKVIDKVKEGKYAAQGSFKTGYFE